MLKNKVILLGYVIKAHLQPHTNQLTERMAGREAQIIPRQASPTITEYPELEGTSMGKLRGN